MGIRETLDKIGTFVGGEPQDDLPDDETRDKYLRSLRRQRRVQMEEMEKVKLQQQIKSFEKKKTQKEVFGIGTKAMNPEGNILRQKFTKEPYMFKTEKGKHKSMLFKKTKLKGN